MAGSLAVVLDGMAGIAAVGAGAGMASAAARRTPAFVRRAHLARDDFAADPLAAALRGGVASFEIAVWLDHAGRLQVGARRWDRDPGNAVGPRVLDRLAARAAARDGRIFERQRGSITLMIEIVEDDPSRRSRAYEALDAVLRRHAPLLSVFRDGAVISGPVTVVLTGESAPRHLLAAQPERFAFVDGNFADVGLWGAPVNLVPIVSEHWAWRFGWDGLERMPPHERRLLRQVVAAAHQEGRRVRFFGLPRRPARVRDRFWGELVGAGVDLITVTSEARGLARYLRRHGSVRDTVALARRPIAPPMCAPPTAVPATAVPATAVPATAVPATAVPTAVTAVTPRTIAAVAPVASAPTPVPRPWRARAAIPVAVAVRDRQDRVER